MRILSECVAVIGIQFQIKHRSASAMFAQMPHCVSPENLHITRPILNFYTGSIFQPRIWQRLRRETGAELGGGVEWIDADIVLRIHHQRGSFWNTNREADGYFGAEAVLVRQRIRVSAGLILFDVTLRQGQASYIDPANGGDGFAQLIIVLRFEKFEHRLLLITAS